MSLADDILAGFKSQLVQAEDFKKMRGGTKSDEYIAYLRGAIDRQEAAMRDEKLRDQMGVAHGRYEVER